MPDRGAFFCCGGVCVSFCCGGRRAFCFAAEVGRAFFFAAEARAHSLICPRTNLRRLDTFFCRGGWAHFFCSGGWARFFLLRRLGTHLSLAKSARLGACSFLLWRRACFFLLWRPGTCFCCGRLERFEDAPHESTIPGENVDAAHQSAILSGNVRALHARG